MAKAFGEETPTSGEDAVSWQTFSDGAGGIPPVTGDADWGKLHLQLSGAEGRSAVYDLGSAVSRTFTLTENRYGTGTEDAALQIRGDTSIFTADSNVVDWEDYTAPVAHTWRYVQVRETTYTYYYVDATLGDDGNAGTRVAPWQTIAKVNAVALVSDDHVLFKRGETWAERLAPVTSGTSGHPIVYGAYGTGAQPIIDGSATTESLTIPFGVAPACYLEFHDIFFSGGSAVVCRIYTHDVLIEDCEVANSATGYGIASSATTADYIYNNTFRGCTIHDNAISGIVIGVTDPGYPYNMIIEDCTIYDNGTSTTAHHGIYVDAGVTVRRNTCYGNSSAGIKCNSEFGIDMRYLPFVYDNVVYGNVNGICMAHNYMTVYNNLIYSNTAYNILWEAGVDHCAVYFNTIVNASSASGCRGVYWNPDPNTDNIIKNNLIIQDSAVITRECMSAGGAGRLADVAANNTFDYNLYYWNGNDATVMFIDGSGGTNLSWNGWRGLAASPDPNGDNLAAVPGFVTRYTDFHPADGGNLKGLGVAIAGYELDKDGNTRADPPTPGCYEEAAA